MIDRTTSIGFYNFGVGYLDTARAARSSRRKPVFSDPCEFLFAQGLELIFKADLLRRFEIETIRKRFGHRLVELRKSLSVDFVDHYQLDAGFDEVVAYLGIGHSGTPFRSRYLQTGVRRVIDLETIEVTLLRFDTRDRSFLTKFFVDRVSI